MEKDDAPKTQTTDNNGNPTSTDDTTKSPHGLLDLDSLMDDNENNRTKKGKTLLNTGFDKQNKTSVVVPGVGKKIIINDNDQNNIQKLTSSSQIRHRKSGVNKDSSSGDCVNDDYRHYQVPNPPPLQQSQPHHTIHRQQEYYRQQEEDYNHHSVNNEEENYIVQIYDTLCKRYPTIQYMTIDLLSTYDAIDSGKGIVWIPPDHFFIDTLTASWQNKWRKRGVTLSNDSTDYVLYGCEPGKYYSMVTAVWQKFIDYNLIPAR